MQEQGYTSRLGKSVWRDLHLFAEHEPNFDLETTIQCLLNHYPCAVCRDHLKTNVKQMDRITSNTDCKIYLWKLHNIVNKMLGKKEVAISILNQYKSKCNEKYYRTHLKGNRFKNCMLLHHDKIKSIKLCPFIKK